MNEPIRKIVVYGAMFLFLSSQLLVTRFESAQTVNKALGLSFIVIWLVFSRRIIYWNRELVLYLGFIFWCLATSTVNGGDWEYSWVHLKTMVQLWVLIMLISGILYDEQDFRWLASVIIAYFIIAYVGSWLGLEAENVGQLNRMQGVTSNPNILGFVCIYALIAVLYLVEKDSLGGLGMMLKWNWWIVFVIFGLLILPTGSRKSLLAMSGIFLGYLLIRSEKNRTLVFGSSLLLIFVVFFFYDSFESYFRESVMGQRLLDSDRLTSGANIRLSLYEQGMSIFSKNPFFGIGINNFQRHSLSGHGTHSYYLEILVGTGIVGFTLVSFIYLSLFQKIVRAFKLGSLNPEQLMALQFLMAAAIMGLGYSYHRSVDHWVILATIAVVLNQENARWVQSTNYSRLL